MQQTFTQTITFIRGGETLSGSLASTGVNFMLVVLVAMVLLFISAILYYFYARSGRGLSRKNKTSRGLWALADLLYCHWQLLAQFLVLRLLMPLRT